MKEITIEEFFKLPKKPISSGRDLEAGKLYYIRDSRNKLNPVYVGRYVKPVVYYNDNSVSYNYNFEDVEYLVNPSKYKQNPSTTFGNLPQYFEVLYPTPTKMDIKNKKSMMKELRNFISEKKSEPRNGTSTISSSRSSRKRSSSRSSSKPSSSKTRSSRKSSKKSSSNRSSNRSSYRS